MTPIRFFSFLLWLLAISFATFAIQSGDVFMYLSLARDFIFSGRWTESTDPYLYSLEGAPLVWTHEYLSYVLFAGAYKALGTPGLIFLKLLAWGSVFALTLFSEPRRRNLSSLWVVFWLLAVFAGSFRFIERSSMFSDLLSVWMVAFLLSRDSIDRKTILILTGVFWLWVQLHPGFAMGLLLVFLWAGYHWIYSKKILTRQLPWLLLPIAVMNINPEGIYGVLYPFQFAINEAVTLKKYNFEWMPSYHPSFRFAPETLAFWLLVAGTLFVLIRQKAWSDLRTIFTLFCLAMAVQTVRFIPWVSFAVLIAIKPWCEWRHIPLKARKWPAVLFAVFAVLLTAKNFIYGYTSSSGERLPRLGLDPKFFPVKTEEFLANNRIGGNLYNSHDFGSYLVWMKQPSIFHHGFVTDMKFYENDVRGVFKSQAHFLELAKKYDWTMLLVEKHGDYQYFFKILSPLPNWKIVAEDEASYLIYHLPD